MLQGCSCELPPLVYCVTKACPNASCHFLCNLGLQLYASCFMLDHHQPGCPRWMESQHPARHLGVLFLSFSLGQGHLHLVLSSFTDKVKGAAPTTAFSRRIGGPHVRVQAARTATCAASVPSKILSQCASRTKHLISSPACPSSSSTTSNRHAAKRKITQDSALSFHQNGSR